MNMREFVKLLDEKGLLIKIKKPVNVKYEASTIMRMLDGKPILLRRSRTSRRRWLLTSPLHGSWSHLG